MSCTQLEWPSKPAHSLGHARALPEVDIGPSFAAWRPAASGWTAFYPGAAPYGGARWPDLCIMPYGRSVPHSGRPGH